MRAQQGFTESSGFLKGPPPQVGAISWGGGGGGADAYLH